MSAAAEIAFQSKEHKNLMKINQLIYSIRL